MGVADLLMPVSTYQQRTPPSYIPIPLQAVIKNTGSEWPCLQDSVNDESQGVSSEQHVTYRKRKRDTEGGGVHVGGGGSWYWMKLRCQERGEEK